MVIANRKEYKQMRKKLEKALEEQKDFKGTLDDLLKRYGANN